MELLHPLVLVISVAPMDIFPFFQQNAQGSCSPRKRVEESDVHTLPTSQHKHKNSREDEDLIENLTQDETSRLDLGFEEWDVAGLPWWFLGNLRSNYTPRSNGSTDIQTHQVNFTIEGELLWLLLIHIVFSKNSYSLLCL